MNLLKDSGYHWINCKVLKDTSNIKIIIQIFSSVIETGHFEYWNTSRVITLFNPGKPTEELTLYAPYVA